jgi:hypothetical protein
MIRGQPGSISIRIDRGWEPSDFAEVLTAIESLYYKVALAHDGPLSYPGSIFRRLRGWYPVGVTDELDQLNGLLLAEARTIAPPAMRLRVARIEYASPGGIDLAGAGQAAEAVDRTIGRLIDFFSGRKQRLEKDKQAEIDTEIKEQNLIACKIDNAEKLLDLMAKYPEHKDLLVALFVRDQDRIAARIAEGLITGQANETESRA